MSRAVIPARIKPGDRVAVVAPSGPPAAEPLARGLARLAGRYDVVVPDGLAERGDGYLSAPDEARAEELSRALRDPDVRAIFVARGGYGLTRVLPLLDAAALRHDPKPIVGFSDATALLAWAREAAGVRGIHGPVVTQLADLPPDDFAWLVRILESPKPVGVLPGVFGRIGAPGGGTVEGRLLGGNLEIVTRLVGTPWQLDLGASVLFLEDVGERPYRLDRALTHLATAGQLDAVRAVTLGSFTRCEPNAGERSPGPMEVLDGRLRDLGLAGIGGLPCGHGARNVALPFGAQTVLDLARAGVVIEDAAVS